MKSSLLKITGILIALTLSSCQFYFGDQKAYPASSDTDSGMNAISQYGIKYMSPSVYGVLWTDVYRKDGFFVSSEKGTKSFWKGQEISYYKIDESVAESLHLKPQINFWQRYGRWLAIPIFILLFIGIWDRVINHGDDLEVDVD